MKYKILLLLILTITSSFAQNKNKTIGFKENKGQILDQNGKPNDAVKYLLNSSGLNVQIKTNGFSYDIYETKKHPLTEKQKAKIHPSFQPEKNKEVIPDYSLEHIYHRIDIDFLNSNPNVELIKEEKSKDYDNFYNVPNKPNGVLKVHRYQQITYKNIYPNIDVIFTVPKDTSKTVEYNFVIHPKGKISDIQLKFRGAETELVDNKIQMSVRFGEMEETLPASWTEDGEVKKEIAVGYKKIKKNVYGFESAENISGKTVVIDPVPIRLWGTYYGGEGEENTFNGIVKTNNQFVYIGGHTSSATNIATSTSHQSSLIEYIDAFISKFNENGERIWGTYYGGNHRDIFRAIDFDNNNNLYALGDTGSTTNIATPGSHQTTYNEWYDVMLIKFDQNGQRIWGTYYGGEFVEDATSIKIDNNQDILIAGLTHSINNIATANSFKPSVPPTTSSQNQGSDGFLAKFSPNGQRIWATYYGGNDGHDAIISIDVDSNNNIFCSGTTTSFNGIATIGAYNEKFNYATTVWHDSFVVKFNSMGERLFGTYYGGLDYDFNSDLKIDNDNNFIISGQTRSIDGIGNTNSYSQNNNGEWDIYLAKFTNNGKLIWSTFYGGSGSDGNLGNNTINIDENNSIYLFSSGTSENNISTVGSYQENLKGYSNLYLIKFKPTGERIWGTYYGGERADYSGDIAYEKNGVFYISGWTYSNTNIASADAFQKNKNGDIDTFLIKFKDCVSNITVTSNNPICTGATLELKASGGTNYSWTGPNGFTSSLQNPTITSATAINSGKYFCSITGTGGCDDTKSIDVLIGDTDAPIPDLTTLPTISGDCNTSITTIPTATDTCAGTITATSSSPLSYILPGTYTIVWNYQDGNGNSVTQEQKIIINAQPLPVSNSPQTFCIQQNATLNSIAITGQNVKWYDALINGNILDNSTSLQNGITYYASQTLNGCESERTAVLINIQNTSTPIANTNQTFCSNQNPTIEAIQATGSNIKWYDASSNGSSIAATTNLIDGTTYYASQTINNCKSPRLGITVSIVDTPASPTANAFQSFCKNENATLGTIQMSGQNIKWYDSIIATVALPNDKILVNNTTYYASQTIGCESSRIPILIRIQDTQLPLAKSNQQFCIYENPLLSNLTISGTAIKWYDTQVSGNILSNTTPLQNGKTYFATQTINGCESERLAVTPTIQDTAPPTAEAIQSFCVQKNAKISDISILGQNINWFDSLTSSISLPESTLLTNRITYYASQTINNCESNKISILITILDATNDECINLVDELPYPKFFTPNNDNFNDTWTIDFNYLEPNSSIRIFDRYGKLVKELRNNDSWDGTYLGYMHPASDYWFTVIRKNGSEFKSHFSLKR
ncbi:DUF7948 domain-containing protein [Flavobacterium tiangeerense]|uniref:DUF7948 domain-containing protein n=1 Tax=Flavobacterium tiangeerense TaxID=459471 RepID=UPI0011A46342|nr:T9SS type B sorting domain-containing protein [Flavobacterium tiangeerense]